MVKFLNTNTVKVPKYYKPYITVSGHNAEIVFSPSHNHNVPIKKLNNFEYVYINNTKDHYAGEIAEYKKSGNRKDNMKNIYKTIQECSRMINCNFFGESNELFLTFTYKENMTDTKKLYEDLKRAMKNLRNQLKGQELLYILTVEPQARGAWHAHILLKNLSWTSSQQWFLDNNWVRNKIWNNKGFVSVKAIKDKNNVGKYITTYLTDLKDGKKYSRLSLYPSKINVYRCSRNCKRPEKIKDKTFEVAINELKKKWEVEELPAPTFVNTSVINDEETNFDIQISKIIINLDYVKPGREEEKFKIEDYIGDVIGKKEIEEAKENFMREKKDRKTQPNNIFDEKEFYSFERENKNDRKTENSLSEFLFGGHFLRESRGF